MQKDFLFDIRFGGIEPARPARGRDAPRPNFVHVRHLRLVAEKKAAWDLGGKKHTKETFRFEFL